MSDINKSYEGQTAETQEELNARMEVLIQQSSAMLQAMQNTQQLAQAAEEQEEDDAVSVDLMELLFYILGKIKYVLLAAVAGALLAGCYAVFLSTTEYQATSKLYIMNQDGLSLDMTDLNIGSALTMDYQEVFKTWEVHQLVREELQLDPAEYGYGKMQSMLTVSNPNDTRILYITVEHEEPEMAVALANAYAKAAKIFIYQTMETAEPNEFSVALTAGATGMGTKGYIMLGFMGGFAAAVAVLILLFLLDDRPHTPNDITKVAGIPTLAVVPREEAARKNSRSRNRKGKHSKRSHSHTHSSGSSRSAK